MVIVFPSHCHCECSEAIPYYWNPSCTKILHPAIVNRTFFSPIFALESEFILKKITAILVLFAVLMQLSSKLVIFLGYSANRQFIANTLCINKSKPVLHCNGKCHLAKQLQKEEKKENSAAFSLKEKLEIMAGLVAGYSFTLTATSFPFPLYVNGYSYFSSSDIFHPPLA